jgi:crotonobetainyl-CoA:carnitine CoA-transferase CaiB-like acyl-CoA transferase
VKLHPVDAIAPFASRDRHPILRVRGHPAGHDEALGLEQLTRRNLLHRFETVPDVDRPVTVPVAAFRFADGGPRVDTPTRALGADTDAVLGELGLTAAEIGSLRQAHVV